MPSIYPVDPSDVDTFTVITNPIRTYTSSALGGPVGSVYLFARRSPTQKDIVPDSSFVDSAHDDADLSSLLRAAQIYGQTVSNDPTLTGSWTSGSYSFAGSWVGTPPTSMTSYSSGSFSSGSYPSGSFSGSTYNPLGIFSSSGIFTPSGVVLDNRSGTYAPSSVFVPDFTTPGSFISGSWSSGSFPTGSVVSGTYFPSGIFTSSGIFTPYPIGYFSTGGQFVSEFTYLIDQYLSGCTAQEQALRLQETLDVNRFSPPPIFNSNTLRKLIIKDQLNTYYRTSYPSAHWSYTNYNTLNFFTASTVPTDSVIMYPNIDGGDGDLVYHAGYVSGTYTPSGSFSFDFYINPRYQQDQPGTDFKAGTILHLSSTFCLSLVSGSGVDVNGRTTGFRLQLQLSQSADIPPSSIYQDAQGVFHTSAPASPSRPFNTQFIFLSNDNVLKLNNWHHVTVRWGTDQINHGLGSFYIDGGQVGNILIPSSSITPSLYDITQFASDLPAGVEQNEPTVLCLGNFYDGPNNDNNRQGDFFALDPATRDGLNWLGGDSGIETPTSYSFAHPLNAELHNVSIRRCYLSNYDVVVSASQGPTFLDKSFAFYVPPFFTTDSPYRQFVNDHGGILITPFEEVDGNTTQPFSVALSFGVAGHYINLENFVKDFAGENFPMLYHLTGVALQGDTQLETCNQFLYSQPFVAKRNLTILPCDDGLFVPSFQLLVSESATTAVDDLGLPVLSFINLDNMVNTGTLLFGGGTSDDGSQPSSQVNAFSNVQLGATSTSPFAPAGPATMNYINTVTSGSDVEAGAPLDVFQQTQDPSSNEVVIYDISNMFYGFRIWPGSFSLQDPDLLQSSMLGSMILSGTNLIVSGVVTGTPAYQGYNSNGPIKMTLADDGSGNIYRADCFTSQSTWNTVGNIYYDEGLVVLKSPHVYFFGQNEYNLSFRGEQHVHVMRIESIAPSNQMNSSSNPNFVSIPPNGYPNSPEDTYVNITGLNFHDSDMNVVMKTTLAQPIQKLTGDRVLFKIKYDF